jgi:cysteine sulfinate desulfinase/cysteine desulfurase-like protein
VASTSHICRSIGGPDFAGRSEKRHSGRHDSDHDYDGQHEIGTILPIPGDRAVAREKGILFHTTPYRRVGHIPRSVEEMNIDLLSMAHNNFRGPKGVGALYIKKGIYVPALLQGGGQEKQAGPVRKTSPGSWGKAAALEESGGGQDANLKTDLRHAGQADLRAPRKSRFRA